MASTPPFSETRSDAAGAFDDATGRASGMADKARDAAQDFGARAQGAAEGVREQAMKFKDQALDSARSAAHDGKEKAAGALADVAQNVRQAADQLGQNKTIAPVGKFANQAADAIENFAGTLRDKDVDQLIDDVSGFVRRNPSIAIGVAVAVGFALVSALRPSRTHADDFKTFEG